MRFIREKGNRYMVLLIVCIMMIGVFPVGVYAANPEIVLRFTLDGQAKSFEEVVNPTPKSGADLRFFYLAYPPAGGMATASPNLTKGVDGAYRIARVEFSYSGTWDLFYLDKDDKWSYFSGWSYFGNQPLPGDQPLPIAGSPLNVYFNYYTVTFKDGDTVLDTQIVLSGQTPSTPSTPTKPGYTFTGWSPTIASVTRVTTYTATWEATSYPVTINVRKDGAAYGTGAPTITFGTTAGNAVANGTSVANGTYNIYANAIDTGKDVTVYGSSASIDLNYYTVTFRNDTNTSTLDAQVVLSEQTAVYGETTPTKTSTAQYSYEFSRWVTTAGGSTEATLTNITAPKTVYASFTQTLRSYTITWKKDGTTTIGNTTVAYGSTPSSSAPTKTGYSFNDWTPTIVSVTGDATYTATWTTDTYIISYNLNGGLASDNPTNYTIESDSMTLNNPTRTGYTFVGWIGTGLIGNTNQTVTIATNSTGNKAYTANWKADAPTTAPDITITARTDKSLTIKTTLEGYEYSVNGTNWHTGTEGSYTFTGLTAGTPYNLVYRKAAVTIGNTSAESDASPALSVSTKYAAPDAPSINVALVEATVIRLTPVNDAEYSKDNGTTWQVSNEFSGLHPATQYTFAIRIKETDDTVAGIKASKVQYTAAATPAVGEGYTIDYSTEKISIDDGYEISSDWNYSTGTLITSGATVTPGVTYYVRVAVSGDIPKSFSAQFTLPARPTSPSGMTISKTSGSINIAPTVEQEYKIGSGVWQDGGDFTGLEPNTGYIVYARVKTTDTTFASNVYSMNVTTKSVGSVTVPTPDAVTYDPGKTLADITLPANWAWNVPATAPTVAISSYSAIYTPTDTDTVDYASVDGYAVDGSGTVTIIKTVNLTVNRATPIASDFNYTLPASLDYSGTQKSATVQTKDNIVGMGVISIRYYKEGVETAPINTGNYTVSIDIVQGDNYTSATTVTDSAWTFTIAKIAQAPLTITGKPDSITYGDTTFSLTTTGGSGTGNVTWDVTEGSAATVDENTGAVIITGISETTITVTKVADSNYIEAVTDTYTFTPEKLQLIVNLPTVEGDWTKVYNGDPEFDKSSITVGGILNKVGADDLTVSVIVASYDTADVGSGKGLTIVYEIDGTDSENYSKPESTVIKTASIAAATPTVRLVNKTLMFTNKIIEIDPATVTGVEAENDITANYDGTINYTYYTKDTLTEADKTTVERSGAETIGGAPKNGGTYYVKATITVTGNYTEAVSNVATLRIYYPSSGQNNASSPVIIDGKVIDMATSEIKDNTTTVVVDQKKMSEQLEDAKDSVVIPITAKTDTASAQLVVQNLERMTESDVSLTIIAGDTSYSIPSGAIDTDSVLKALGATDSSKVPLNITISKISESAVTIEHGMLIMPPVAFTVTASYNGKSVSVVRFESYVERIIEIPEGTDPESITTAVVMASDGTQHHVPTSVFQKDGKWYVGINSITNSTYSVIWNPVTVKSVENHWSKAVVNDMASRLVIKNPETFMPDQNITRGEFAEYITKAIGIHRAGVLDEKKFTDVETTHELAYAIELATAYSIINGYPDGTFKPNEKISREEAMVMYARAMTIVGLEELDNQRIETYMDKDEVADWAYDHVKKTVSAGVFNGKTHETINPKDTFTYAEAATAIRNLLVAAGLINK